MNITRSLCARIIYPIYLSKTYFGFNVESEKQYRTIKICPNYYSAMQLNAKLNEEIVY